MIAPAPTTPTPLTPLVVRFGAFGDMILLIPLLKVLLARYGRPCDVVSSGAWTEPLLQRVPAAGRRIILTSRRAPYWFNRSQRQLVVWLRQRRPGPVYVLETDAKTHWLLRRGGIAPAMICSMRDWPRAAGEHVMAHALRLARATPPSLQASHAASADSVPVPDARPDLTADDRRDCQAWLEQHRANSQPLVLLQPGNKKTMRRGNRRRRGNVNYWSEANWAQVIAGVRQSLPGARVILCGSPTERSLAADILAQCRGSTDDVIVAAGELPIPRLLALLERAHSMISVNTGPAHAAAAMGCPLVVLFDRNPRREATLYAPQATSSEVRILLSDPAHADESIASIPPELVLATWRLVARR